MLVFKRRKNDEVRIDVPGGELRIVVIETHRSWCKLGFDGGPEGLVIYRVDVKKKEGSEA